MTKRSSLQVLRMAAFAPLCCALLLWSRSRKFEDVIFLNFRVVQIRLTSSESSFSPEFHLGEHYIDNRWCSWSSRSLDPSESSGWIAPSFKRPKIEETAWGESELPMRISWWAACFLYALTWASFSIALRRLPRPGKGYEVR